MKTAVFLDMIPSSSGYMNQIKAAGSPQILENIY
jgi:hypothetical protein